MCNALSGERVGHWEELRVSMLGTDRDAAAGVDAPCGTIAAIRATPVNVPLEAPYRWSVGTFPGLSKTIVEVESTDGAVGIGEAPSTAAATLIEQAIAPRLLGADPANLADCERRALPPVRVMRNSEDDAIVRAWGGVELALWDLVGRLQNRSVASLLGGRVRDEVAFTEYFAPRLAHDGRGGESTPTDIARYCAAMAEAHGSTVFEGKVGVDDVASDVAVAREVRAAIGPDAVLRLDANKRWDVATAREALHRMEPYLVRSIEDPARSAAEMARLRPGTSISFSSHDPDLALAAQLGVPDAFVLNLSVLGGIRRSVAFINACEELGVNVWFYSPDTGVMNAAYLQVAAAVEWVSEPSQTLLRWHTDDVVVGGPFQPRNGVLEVPAVPASASSSTAPRCAAATSGSSPRGPTATTTTRRGPAATGASSREARAVNATTEAPLRLATDVGGTFIDFVLLDERTGEIRIDKEPAFRDEIAERLFAGYQRLVGGEPLARLIHGSTIAINTILQERGAKVGLITTGGFRDVLESGAATVRTSTTGSGAARPAGAAAPPP